MSGLAGGALVEDFAAISEETGRARCLADRAVLPQTQEHALSALLDHACGHPAEQLERDRFVVAGVDQHLDFPGRSLGARPGRDQTQDRSAAHDDPGIFSGREGKPLLERPLQRPRRLHDTEPVEWVRLVRVDVAVK
jgi:hypothetical protein